jgi:hypothetical protein
MAPRMKSSLQKFYGHHHELVNRYEISISQMRIDGSFRFIVYLWNASTVFEELEVSIVDLRPILMKFSQRVHTSLKRYK